MLFFDVCQFRCLSWVESYSHLHIHLFFSMMKVAFEDSKDEKSAPGWNPPNAVLACFGGPKKWHFDKNSDLSEGTSTKVHADLKLRFGFKSDVSCVNFSFIDTSFLFIVYIFIALTPFIVHHIDFTDTRFHAVIIFVVFVYINVIRALFNYILLCRYNVAWLCLLYQQWNHGFENLELQLISYTFIFFFIIDQYWFHQRFHFLKP